MDRSALPVAGRRARSRDRSIKAVWSRSSGAHRAAVLLILLAGIGLRIWQALLPITGAEAELYMGAGVRTAKELWQSADLRTADPFYTLLMKASARSFGVCAFSVRLPALVAGILLLPVCYTLVRRWSDRRSALFMLTMLAFFPVFVHGSVLAGGDMPALLLWVLTLWAAEGHLRHGTRGPLWHMALWAALAVRMDPVMLVPVLALFGWLVLRLKHVADRSFYERLRYVVFAALLAALLVLVLHLGVLAKNGHFALLGAGVAPLPGGSGELMDWWSAGVLANGLAGAFLLLLLSIGMFYMVWSSSRFRHLFLLVLCTTVPALLIQPVAINDIRWLPILWLLVMAAALAMGALLKKAGKPAPGLALSRMVGIVALIVGAAVPGFQAVVDHGVRRFPEVEAVAGFLAERVTVADRVVVEGAWRAPLAFSLAERELGQGMLRHLNEASNLRYVLVEQGRGRSWQQVLHDSGARLAPADTEAQEVVDLRVLKIFAVP